MAVEEMITTRRLEALTDGIFAFSMTLLVIFIETPQSHHLGTPQQLQLYLSEQYPQFMSYLITFLVLANFWIIHHQISRYITKTNAINLWMNIIFMLFIVLLPFSSMIIGDYSRSWGSVFFIITLLLFIWLYASHHHRLTGDHIDQKQILSVTGQLSVGVFFSAISIITTFIYLPAALYVFLLIPITLLLCKLGNKIRSI